MTGCSKSSNEYYTFDEKSQKMTLAKSIQRAPAEQRWKPEGLQAMNVPCKQLYDRKQARGIQVEGFEDNPEARLHDQGRVRAQRVWIYEKDYTESGITDDCKNCLHNQRWGYNKSKMVHTERCRARMEQALSATDAGRKRLEAAEERMNAKLAKEVEEADARPEGGIGGRSQSGHRI